MKITATNIRSSALCALFVTFSVIARGQSPSAQSSERAVIIERVRNNQIDAILKMGSSGDIAFVPILTELLADQERSQMSYRQIDASRESLARLGDVATRRDIISDLNASGHDRERAFSIAISVGGDDFVAAIASKLFDDRPGEREFDVGYAAPRHQAVIALSKLVDDPTAPKIDLEKITFDEKNVEKWRQWWEANSSRVLNSSDGTTTEE